MAGPKLQGGLDALPPVLIRHTKDHHLGDSWMLRDGDLDVGRVYVESAGDDDGPYAVLHEQETAIIDQPYVTRMQPPIADRFRRFLCHVEIATHQEITTCA